MRIHSLYDYWLGRELNYLVSMSVYHVLIIILFLFGITTDSHIMYRLTLAGSQAALFADFSNVLGMFSSMVTVIIIFIIDVAFLIILMLEFKWMRLNYKRLLALEVGIIAVSSIVPIIRDIMFFLSINSVAIYITYRGLMKLPFFGKLFTPLINISAYLFIIHIVGGIVWMLMVWGK